MSMTAMAQEALESKPATTASISVTDLVGVWGLDAAASDAPDALLTALGRSSMERAMARRIKKVTQTVSMGDGWIEVKNANAIRTETTRTTLGERAEVQLLGQTMVLLATIEDAQVVATGTLELEEGPAKFRSTRGLEDANTMVLTLALTPEAGDAVALRRVFRRQ
jgi:hypothetical protein